MVLSGILIFYTISLPSDSALYDYNFMNDKKATQLAERNSTRRPTYEKGEDQKEKRYEDEQVKRRKDRHSRTHKTKNNKPSKSQLTCTTQILNLTSSMMLKNSDVTEAIDRVGNRLSSVSGVDREYSYHVLHHGTPQAFSMAPGNIFITTGLLDLLEGEEELAALIAREFYMLEDQNRPASIVSSSKIAANLFFIGGIAVGAALIYKITLDRINSDPFSSGVGGGSFANYIIMAAAAVPSMIHEHVHESRLKRSHMAVPYRRGKPLHSSLMDKGAFDTLLMKLLNYGFDAQAELAADDYAIDLLNTADYPPKAVVSLLERFATIRSVELSRLNQASPGLEKRIINARERILGREED
jgi:hypothetical protein